MRPENLQDDLNKATMALLEMARELSWNTIPNNCIYILSEIKGEEKTSHINPESQPLNVLMPQLLKLYPDLYEIDLFIYKVIKNQVIIDIQYIIYDPLFIGDDTHVKPLSPMLHSKVILPVYQYFDKQKFDINWKHNTASHRWKMFWYRLNFRFKNFFGIAR